MPYELLLAMQAAGMVTDFFGSMKQQKLGAMGLKIQQQGIKANINQTRLETEEASLAAMKDLRKNMGTQIAVNAARGTSTSGGSALSIMNESLGDFNADERMRRINQMSRENELKAGSVIAGLNQSGQNSKLWQGFASRTLNTFSSNPEAWGFKSANTSAKKSNYGMTPLGG
jgi:hypothetical protein